MNDRPTDHGDDEASREDPTEKYDEVDPEDVVEDAIELLGEGADDPTPVTPPPPDDDRPRPPNA